MRQLVKYQLNRRAEELSEDIEKAYKRYRVDIGIRDWVAKPDRLIFEVKLKGDTREIHVRARASDVQQRLKLPYFQVITQDFTIYFVVSEKKIVYRNLPKILSDQEYHKHIQEMLLPYVVGYDEIGDAIVVDLAQFPHLLVAGASNSGKTVGLRTLLASLINSRSPQQVNLILIDVGAMDLMPFNGIPHLSCPIVCDREMACYVLASLMDEMERRIKLQVSNIKRFGALPRIILVVDEFPALFAGLEDKKMVKLMTNAISGLLQRGRHARIHVVLAAQNPTMQNMKVDLGNITARIAFKCAKRNFSETILGESGAENLLGKGDMYFKCPQYERMQRIQGAFISPKELQQELYIIKHKWLVFKYDFKEKFTISEPRVQQIRKDLVDNSVTKLMPKADVEDKKFANIVLWCLGQHAVSCNLLMKNFSLGWNRADRLMKRLNEGGIVERLDTKLPRKVLPQSIADLPEKMMKFLLDNGVSSDEVVNAISNRD